MVLKLNQSSFMIISDHEQGAPQPSNRQCQSWYFPNGVHKLGGEVKTWKVCTAGLRLFRPSASHTSARQQAMTHNVNYSCIEFVFWNSRCVMPPTIHLFCQCHQILSSYNKNLKFTHQNLRNVSSINFISHNWDGIHAFAGSIPTFLTS